MRCDPVHPFYHRRCLGDGKPFGDSVMLKAYTINTECGYLEIASHSISEAKDIYSRDKQFSFDDCKNIPGSWYRITDSSGELLESQGI